jgi:hypothetical protein
MSDSSHNISSNVLIELKVLQRFFSCKDGLEDLFKVESEKESIPDRKSLLCQHGTGLHPSTVAKLKLLPNELNAVITRILEKEYSMFVGDEMPFASNQPIKISNLTLNDGNIVCKECSTTHQLELRRKFAITVVSQFRIGCFVDSFSNTRLFIWLESTRSVQRIPVRLHRSRPCRRIR